MSLGYKLVAATLVPYTQIQISTQVRNYEDNPSSFNENDVSTHFVRALIKTREKFKQLLGEKTFIWARECCYGNIGLALILYILGTNRGVNHHTCFLEKIMNIYIICNSLFVAQLFNSCILSGRRYQSFNH